ncbi:MAG: ABC transporter permease, partial [Thermoproteota archaeon]
IICFIILMTVSYYTFPGFLRAPTSNLMLSALDVLTGVYVVIFLFSLVFLAPRFLGEFKSERGVSLIPALRIAVLYSIGNLKRRRFRTLLTLFSIITMVLAMSTLTSIRVSLTTNSHTLVKTWPADKPPMAIVARPPEFLTPEDLRFIGMQREILELDYKVITPVAYGALGYVDNVPIYGVRGISRGDPSFKLIKDAIYPEDSVEKLFNSSDSILVSRNLASMLNIDVGMTIVFNGIKLRIIGVFNSDLIASIKEPDGSDFLPLFIPGPESGPRPVPTDSLFLTNIYTAQKLGGHVYAVYCTFEDNLQTREVSKRLASLGDYFVIAMPSSESITYFFRETLFEVFGASIFVPVGITILNIAVLFYTIVYERREEIFIFSSIGLNPTNISSLFIIEAGMLGFIGGCIGYISSMLMFKMFEVSNLIVPINVKSSPLDMLYLIMVSSTTAIVASWFPALKAAKIATPSLLRRWKMEGKVVGEGIWTEQLPVKIPPEKIEAFVDHLYERLPQGSVISESMVSNIERGEEMDENGNIMYSLSFKYVKGGSKPFNALAKVEIRKEGENYISHVHAGPETLRKNDVYEVVNYVRRLALEWAASKFSLVIAVGESIDGALAIVKKYRPQLLLVYSRLDVGNKLRDIRRRLRSEGIWPPTIEAKKVETRDIRLLVEKLSEEITSVDAVCLDSDDGLLSSALLIAAIQLDKNILLLDSEGKMYEMAARRFVENFKH